MEPFSFDAIFGVPGVRACVFSFRWAHLQPVLQLPNEKRFHWEPFSFDAILASLRPCVPACVSGGRTYLPAPPNPRSIPIAVDLHDLSQRFCAGGCVLRSRGWTVTNLWGIGLLQMEIHRSTDASTFLAVLTVCVMAWMHSFWAGGHWQCTLPTGQPTGKA